MQSYMFLFYLEVSHVGLEAARGHLRLDEADAGQYRRAWSLDREAATYRGV